MTNNWKVRCTDSDSNVKMWIHSLKSGHFLPPASAVEVIESEPSFCVSVCLSVSTLTAEPFDHDLDFWYGS